MLNFLAKRVERTDPFGPGRTMPVVVAGILQVIIVTGCPEPFILS